MKNQLMSRTPDQRAQRRPASSPPSSARPHRQGEEQQDAVGSAAARWPRSVGHEQPVSSGERRAGQRSSQPPPADGPAERAAREQRRSGAAASSWVTRCTSMSPESRTTVADDAGAEGGRPAAAAAGPSTIWVALTPRAKSRSAVGDVVTDDGVEGAAERLRRAAAARRVVGGRGRPARRCGRRAAPSSSPPAPRSAMRAPRRMQRSRPSGPPVRATTTRSRAGQGSGDAVLGRGSAQGASSTRSATHSSASSRSAVRLPARK